MGERLPAASASLVPRSWLQKDEHAGIALVAVERGAKSSRRSADVSPAALSAELIALEHVHIGHRVLMEVRAAGPSPRYETTRQGGLSRGGRSPAPEGRTTSGRAAD
jgi:hypothetical protein